MVKEAILMSKQYLYHLTYIDESTGRIAISKREAKKALRAQHEVRALGLIRGRENVQTPEDRLKEDQNGK